MNDLSNLEKNRNNIVESKLEVHQENLKKIFGPDAEFSLSYDQIKVGLKLKDGVCPGGQQIQADLIEVVGKNTAWYEAKELIVDNISFPNLFGNKFIFKVPSESTKMGEVRPEPEIITHLNKFVGTQNFDPGIIQIVNLEDADGLAAILHENGHSRDRRPKMFNDIDLTRVREYIRRKGRGYKKSVISEVRQSGEDILNCEMFANNMAIQTVLELKSNGNDLFKSDEELVRLKKFLITTTALRFRNAPDFIKLVGKEKINEILSFKNP